jgi:hypothetical protein
MFGKAASFGGDDWYAERERPEGKARLVFDPCRKDECVTTCEVIDFGLPPSELRERIARSAFSGASEDEQFVVDG